MIRNVHNGKIRRGEAQKENHITAKNFSHSMIHTVVEKTAYAEVKCPLCDYVNQVPVSEEKQMKIVCKCGVELNFEVPE